MRRDRRERLRAALKTAMVDYEQAMDASVDAMVILRGVVREKQLALDAARWPEMTFAEHKAVIAEVMAEREGRRGDGESATRMLELR